MSHVRRCDYCNRDITDDQPHIEIAGYVYGLKNHEPEADVHGRKVKSLRRDYHLNTCEAELEVHLARLVNEAEPMKDVF